MSLAVYHRVFPGRALAHYDVATDDPAEAIATVQNELVRTRQPVATCLVSIPCGPAPEAPTIDQPTAA